MSVFIFPAVVSAGVFLLAFFWGGLPAFLLVALLAILETTLSFDNAVVNAKVLGRMDARWQRRFLVWGIPVAVFGTRFVLPILIVAAAAFGSAFLLMVSLKFFFDERKTVHWIEIIERHLTRWGGIAAIEIIITLSVMLLCALRVPGEKLTVLVAGVIGVVLFVVMEAVA